MGFELTNKDLKFLSQVHPDLARVIRRAATISPVPFKLKEGIRTLTRQKQLVAQGYSKTLNSRHLTGHAVDLVPLIDVNGDGKISTDETYHWPAYYKLAPFIKQAAKLENVPLEWGGDWKSFKDGPHWQLPYKSYPRKVVGTRASFISNTAFEEPEYTDESEAQARTKDVGATTLIGGTGVTSSIFSVLDTLTSQQAELTSGDYVRIAIALGILALTVWLIIRQLRRPHPDAD